MRRENKEREKTNLLALYSFHSEAEYHTKKKNTRLERNTVFSYIPSSVDKGGKIHRRASPPEECEGGH